MRGGGTGGGGRGRGRGGGGSGGDGGGGRQRRSSRRALLCRQPRPRAGFQHSAAAFELAPARYPEDAVGRAALSIVIALPWAALADADVPMWCCDGPWQAP